MKRFPTGVRLLLLLPLLFSAAGCSRKAPDIADTKVNLVLELFSMLDRQDYKTALAKTRRLQSLDPANANLKELEQILLCNIPMAEASELYQKGKREEAVQVLEKAIQGQGAVAELTGARQEMLKLIQLNQITDELLNPTGTLALRAAADDMRRLRKNDPRLRALTEFAAVREKQCMPKLLEEEQRLALYGILEDLERCRLKEPEKKEAFSAQKELFEEQLLK